MDIYTEGKARIRAGNAFLNEKARVSRDVSVAYVSVFKSGGSNLADMTAATGIRCIRYGLESGITSLTAIEINRGAYLSLRANLAANRIRAKSFNKSIQEFANTADDRFDFVDLDPFGGISPYIFDLMKISRSGTHLMATATDTAVLCGADRKACMRIYSARPIHNELCHESAVRIMLAYIARQAAQFNFGIRVRFSFLDKHYIRTFVELEHGAKKALGSIETMGHLYYCHRCGSARIGYGIIAEGIACENCKKRKGAYGSTAYGPMWLGPLMERYAAERMRRFLERNDGMSEASGLVKMIGEEPYVPFYYRIPTVTRRLGIGSVSPRLVLEELRERGFSASYTHMSDYSIKTDADISDVTSCVEKAAERS